MVEEDFEGDCNTGSKPSLSFAEVITRYYSWFKFDRIDGAIISAYQERYQRNWDKIYIAIDLHGTIIPKYDKSGKINVYKDALEALQDMSSMEDIDLILFTSTFPENLELFYDWCEKNSIHFKYLNENKEVLNTSTGDFSNKFYFNVLIDDRAGFQPAQDWNRVQMGLSLAQKMFKCPRIGECSQGFVVPFSCLVCKELSLFKQV